MLLRIKTSTSRDLSNSCSCVNPMVGSTLLNLYMIDILEGCHYVSEVSGVFGCDVFKWAGL